MCINTILDPSSMEIKDEPPIAWSIILFSEEDTEVHNGKRGSWQRFSGESDTKAVS